MNSTKALSRTWQTVTTYRECSVVVEVARAARLHRIMGRVGLPDFQHYGLAATGLREPFPLTSLASLTEQEARRVWAYLCRCFPGARFHLNDTVS